MTWASLSPGFFENLIFSEISPKYHDLTLVLYSYLTSIVIYSFVIAGTFIGVHSKNSLPQTANKILNTSSMDRLSRPSSAISLYLTGVAIYLYFLSQIGGLFSLWENIWLRTTLTAGLGYYQAAYTSLIIISTALIYPELIKKQKWALLSAILALSLFILASLGQRAPSATLCFILVLTHHYRVNKLKSPLNFKTGVIASILIAFMFTFVQIRSSGQNQEASNFERDVLLRLATIERQVVTLGYFDENPFWYEGIYSSLIYAPIPRLFFSDKPPIDTGVYLNMIRQGYELNPPLPANQLDASSWPDGFLAGYISMGFPGLIIVCLASGYLFGFFYRVYLSSEKPAAPVTLYAYTGFMGVTPLSPLGITMTLSLLIPFLVLGFLSMLFLKDRGNTLTKKTRRPLKKTNNQK